MQRLALALLFLLLVTAVAAVLVLLIEGSSSPTGPRINDHWHARYAFFACGEKQPNAPHWTGGIATESDGIIHIQPIEPFEEGRGARLVKWFEYGGGELTVASIRMPGVPPDDHANIWTTGETCPGGSPGVLQVFVNGEPLERWDQYIPQDGDEIEFVFGPQR